MTVETDLPPPSGPAGEAPTPAPVATPPAPPIEETNLTKSHGRWTRVRSRITPRLVSGVALTLLVAGAAYVAVSLHRRGHTTGDDWALYLRMAQSLFDGNMSDVISDNRLLYENSTAVTPPIYPWGWPLLLAPFVRLFGVDFNTATPDELITMFGRLKLIEVAVFCAWLVLFHGIVRRRAGRIVAFAVTAVFATSYTYLVHTDQLLTEFPHMLAVAVVVWWLDRVMTRSRLTAASTSDLVILGLLMVLAYNVRREGVVFVAVVAAAQFVDLLGATAAAADRGEPPPYRRGRNPIGSLPWRRLLMPYLTFAAGAAIAQFLLPSTLLPDNNNSVRNIFTRWWASDERPNRGNYPFHLVRQLGLRFDETFGRWVLVLAAVGAVVACVRSPRRNVPLATLCLGTMVVIGTHFRMVDRYYFQVTPWILVFLALLFVTVLTGIARLVRNPLPLAWKRAVAVMASFPFVWLAIYHVTDLPRRIDYVQGYNDDGNVQKGPASSWIPPAMEAVQEYTHPDDIVVFYRARTLTLFTGRRAVQTTSFSNMVDDGDWFLQSTSDDYSQPDATEQELLDAGFELVWEESPWRLWRIPDDPAALASGSPEVQPAFPSVTRSGPTVRHRRVRTSRPRPSAEDN